MWEEEKKFALPCVQDCQVFLAGKKKLNLSFFKINLAFYFKMYPAF